MEIKTATGNIDKFIFRLDSQTQARVLRYIELLEKYGNRLAMPYSKSLKNGLFEMRIQGIKNIRIIYFFHQNTIYLLNIFTKKTNKIPKKEINLALKRYQILA